MWGNFIDVFEFPFIFLYTHTPYLDYSTNEISGFPDASVGKESACSAEDTGDMRRAWQPTPVFLPAKILWTEEPDKLQSMGLQRVRHN